MMHAKLIALLATVAAIALSVCTATAATQRPSPTIKQAHRAIHRADAYAFIGRCHRTRYSVICRVEHEFESCTEAGACTTGTITMADRVHWVRDRAIVSTLWESTASVPI